ncbi:hypothetical protein [Cellulomonas sp. PSBB021]|uniref:hypothetical protein n=1 Tax=Cellulomonas sp. PSBB021 TaxID=2003551 RepID=UPI0012FE2101|nr:hypothetical protein [Cellulomonas sp. PSBB021]
MAADEVAWSADAASSTEESPTIGAGGAEPSSATSDLDADTGSDVISIRIGGEADAGGPLIKIGFIVCNLWSDKPHYSNGAGGVIYKVRGECKKYGVGLENVVKVHMNGTLTKDGVVRATRYGTFSIKTDGTKHTWYVPLMNSGGSGCGTWKGRNVVTSTVPSGIAPDGVVFSSTRSGCLRG